MSADQPCAACRASEAACMSSRTSCCEFCAMAAGFTHGPPSDQESCPDASHHDEVAACPSCSYASRRWEEGR